jgi:hypothetical protein
MATANCKVRTTSGRCSTTDGNGAGTTSLVSDNPMLVRMSNLNEPTKTQEPVSNAENRRDKGKQDVKQTHRAERDGKQEGPQLEGGEGRYEISGLRCVDPRRLGKLEVADFCIGRCTPALRRGCLPSDTR